ncbi:hypothetical protein GC194_01150 [bacterium]|nr:hypothetical protein [bacterium]
MTTLPNIPQLPIAISDRAEKKLIDYNELLNFDQSAYIRIGVKKEGAHLKKILGVDEKRFTDQVYSHGDLKFVIDRRELKHLLENKIDFRETSNQKGFIFRALK